MKLNPDCIRDILLAVEENTGASKNMYYSPENQFDGLSQYSAEEIRYHIIQCEQFGLIRNVNKFLDGGLLIGDLSPNGHMFLADIRSVTNWNKTKEIAQKVGSTSLDAISKIASDVIAALIKSQF